MNKHPHPAWQQLRQSHQAIGASTVLLTMALCCSVGPWLLQISLGYTYNDQHLSLGATPPSLMHLFGTDFHGRDLLTRVLVGGQISLTLGFAAAAVAGLVGTLYGAIAGFLGGRIDHWMMRLVDVIDALPYMFLVIVLTTWLGKNLFLLFVALGLVGWLMTARLVRGQVLSLKNQEFMQAAKALGLTDWQMIWRHLIPNTLGPVIVYFTLTVPSMILQEAFLSFLGLGVQAPYPSLGQLVSEGIGHMTIFWWELVFPSMMLAMLLLALNFLGDSLRDAHDPKAVG